MAIRRRLSRGPDRRRGEKHGWLWLDRYELIHREVLAAHPSVIADRTRFVPVADRADHMRCRGHIVCRGRIEIEVDRRLAVRSVNNRTQVLAFRYRYHARLLERGTGRNVLRYDSGHAHTPDVYHRHEYDPATGHDRLTRLSREEFRVLSEMVDELAEMFSHAT